MSLLKRVELWVLLAIAVAGIIFAFRSKHHEDDQGAGESTAGTTVNDAPLVLHRCVLKRDYGTARLDIELKVRNDDTKKLIMQSPDVKLITGKGRETPGFYLAFEPPPEIPANSTQDVKVRYWLTAEDLQGTLTFDVKGQKLQVKGGTVFDLNSVPNLEEKVFKAGEW